MLTALLVTSAGSALVYSLVVPLSDRNCMHVCNTCLVQTWGSLLGKPLRNGWKLLDACQRISGMLPLELLIQKCAMQAK